jgi:hypothetical protein
MKRWQLAACSVSLLVCRAPLRLTSLCPSGRVPQQPAILHTRRHQGQRWLRLRHRREPGDSTGCTCWPALMTTLSCSSVPLAALAEGFMDMCLHLIPPAGSWAGDDELQCDVQHGRRPAAQRAVCHAPQRVLRLGHPGVAADHEAGDTLLASCRFTVSASQLQDHTGLHTMFRPS